MGADKKFSTKKCGEILLNLKTNKKSKVYIFNCAFCNENYDQLKKFSFHLDDKHSQHLSEELITLRTEENQQLMDERLKEEELTTDDIKLSLEVFVPDIKSGDLDEELDEVPADEIAEKVFEKKMDSEGEDPLMMRTSRSALYKMDDVKQEKDLDDCEGTKNIENEDDFNCEVRDFNDADNVDGSVSENASSDEEDKPLAHIKNVWKTRKTPPNKKKRSDSDGSTDDSKDSDFELELEFKNKKKIQNRKSLQKPQKAEFNVDEKLLLTKILDCLEKLPILWDVKSRSRKQTILQKAYETITEEVNEKLKIEMKWGDVRRRIQEVRYNYSLELEKKQNGENFEMPWYTENIKFLAENIDVLVKNRFESKKYKRLKTLDESHLPILIEYYKNCEILWQVTNIAFVVKPKRFDALNLIIQELKEKQNIDISLDEMKKRIKYINRIYSKDREQELKCEADQIEFVPSSKYYKDLTFLRDSQGPFKCPHCDETILRYDNYHMHVSEHTNALPFKCVLCEMAFSKMAKYIVHAKRHLRVFNYHCDICGKGYPFKAELEWHYREHTGEEPYLCEICGASFRSRNGHDNHVRRHDNRFRFECHICKQGFNQLHSLKAHVKVHLNIRDILCNVCGKGFTARNHLRNHQQIHSDVKRHKCLGCGKAFAQHSGLRAHRRVCSLYVSSYGNKR